MSAAGEVEVEWGGRRYRATVDKYGGARIIGGPLREVPNEEEKAMENKNRNEPEVTTVVDVGDFVEKLLARQTEFELEIRGKLDALDQVVKTALRDATATIEALIEKRMRLPAPEKGSTN